jgi:hypothetical protein
VGGGIGVGDGVVQDDDPVVAVHRFAHGAEHDAAGADAGQDERGDRTVPKPAVEVGGGERADASLADGDVVRLRAETFVDLAARGVGVQLGAAAGRRQARHHARGWDGVELGVVEGDPDPGDVPAASADVGDRGIDPLEQCLGFG